MSETLPLKITNYDDIVPENLFISPCAGCGQSMICDCSTPLCNICQEENKIKT